MRILHIYLILYSLFIPTSLAGSNTIGEFTVCLPSAEYEIYRSKNGTEPIYTLSIRFDSKSELITKILPNLVYPVKVTDTDIGVKLSFYGKRMRLWSENNEKRIHDVLNRNGSYRYHKQSSIGSNMLEIRPPKPGARRYYFTDIEAEGGMAYDRLIADCYVYEDRIDFFCTRMGVYEMDYLLTVEFPAEFFAQGKAIDQSVRHYLKSKILVNDKLMCGDSI